MAEKANTETPIEKKKWYKNIMAIIGMVSALAGAVYGVMQILESSLFKPKKVFTNIEIVLDRSASMNESFDGSTKWQAAVSAVKESLETKIAKSDNLAFRHFGGDCEDDNNTHLVVEFDQNNEAEVRNTLRKINLAGKTTLVNAIVEATGDFNDPERFGDVRNSIIVITGGGDFCHPNPTQAIHDRLRGRIEVSFRLIGMGLTDEQKSDFEKIATATGGKALFADSQKELPQVLERSLEEAQAFYINSFDGVVGAEWSNTSTDVTPVGERKFLGQLGNDSVSLTLSNLLPHTEIRVSFDLLVIQSWDGNDTTVGPDIWDLSVQDSSTLLHTTFSKGQRQAYPDPYPGGDHPARTGVTEYNTLGYSYYGDAVYHLSYTFPHSASSLVLNFSASGLQGLSDESWGLDNVNVAVLNKEPALVGYELVGTWERTEDGSMARFYRVDANTYKAYITNLGPLGKYQFYLNEHVFTVHRGDQDNVFIGKVKWRWTSGSSEWRPVKITMIDTDQIETDSVGTWKLVKQIINRDK